MIGRYSSTLYTSLLTVYIRLRLGVVGLSMVVLYTTASFWRWGFIADAYCTLALSSCCEMLRRRM
jgi:hypothetical protein